MLDKYTLLLLEEGHCFRDQALELCRTQLTTEKENFQATSLETLRNMVRAGSGITLIPKVAITRDEKELHYIPFSAPAPERIIGLVWRKTSTKKEVFHNFKAAFS